MIRKIVVPVDGSAASERIIPHLAELRRAVGAEIHAIHITIPDLFARVRGRGYLRSLVERADGIVPFAETDIRTGEPAFEIMKYAVVEHADLLALTTRGSSSLRRLFFGSTAIELLRSSQVPLFIARPECPARPVRRILAAVDSSATSLAVLPLVADLARGMDAEVLLTGVLTDRQSPKAAARFLDREARALSGEGVRVDSLVRAGDPAREILAAARDAGAGLIALGTHGRRGADRFFFGSVAESVLLGAAVPLVLRRSVRVARFLHVPARGARR